MGWASGYIRDLQEGKTVRFRPHGNSMLPRIKSGALCEVEPLGDRLPVSGDVVLCRVAGRQFLHYVQSVFDGNRFQIANAKGHVNGVVGIKNIFGILTQVLP